MNELRCGTCGHDAENHERYHDIDSYGQDCESQQCLNCDCIWFTLPTPPEDKP